MNLSNRKRAVGAVAIIVGAATVLVASRLPSKPALQGTFSQHTIDIAGMQRSYQLYIPAKLSASAPIVFVLHGSKLHGDIIRLQTGYQFDVSADREGFVVVYPNGYENHWNDCRATASYAANRENIDDIAFFREMVRILSRKHDASDRDVFAIGHSNGGHMAFKLALEAPDLVRGVAAVSANMPLEENLDCEPTGKPVSVAVFNGTVDPINRWEGGPVVLFGDTSRGPVYSTEQTIAYWNGLAGIAFEPQTQDMPDVDHDPSTHVIRRIWRKNNIEVRLYELTGSGHVIPSRVANLGLSVIFGPPAQDIETADEVWDFFAAVRRPSSD